MDFERLTQDRAHLGEGPCWHAEEAVLYSVDILGKRLHRFDPQRQAFTAWDLPEMPGTVAPRRRGGLVLGLENGLAFFDPRSGQVEEGIVVDPNPQTRLNDGKCDPQGRFWIGSMDREEKEAIGGFFSVGPSGEVRQWADGIGVSNGMTWSPDQRRMYYIDSPTRRVDLFDMNPETGEISNRRPFLEFEEDEGFPDGMTSDAYGNLWIAHWAGARVSKRDGKTGQLLATYPTRAWQTSACSFGGDDLQDLYITSARVDLTSEQKKAYPESGHLLRHRGRLKGCPTYAFAG